MNNLEIIDLQITSGKSVLITVKKIHLTNNQCYNFEFCLTNAQKLEYENLIIGTEKVSIRSGLTGNVNIVETKSGNVFYADKLKLEYCYRLVFGNDAPTSTTVGGLGHFLNLNTPYCSRAYDPANTKMQTEEEPEIKKPIKAV